MNFCKMAAALPVILVAALTITTANAADGHQPMEWHFDVALDGKPIGYHTFDVRHDGPRQILTTEASFDVKFLFITAFRYRHQNTEIWADGCLSSIDAKTDSNGKVYDVRGNAQDDVFDLSGNAASISLKSDCVQTFAYWNPSILEARRLLNSQTGEYEDISTMLEGYESIEVDGQQIAAARYRLSAKAGDIRLWYSRDDQTWLALEAPAKGGRTIRYSAVRLPTITPADGIVATAD